MIKIGTTNAPYKRFLAMQNGAGSFIKSFYVSESMKNNLEIEKHLHEHFSENRTIGEWYKNLKFKNVVQYISSYIEKHGELMGLNYVALIKENSEIIDIEQYVEIFSKLLEMERLLFPEKTVVDDISSKMDNLIYQYEKLLYSDFDKMDKVLGLAKYADLMKKAIFDLLKNCGAKYVLENKYFYGFFNKYYNVEKVGKCGIKGKYEVLC